MSLHKKITEAMNVPFPFSFPPAICLLLIPGGKTYFHMLFSFAYKKMEFYIGLLLFNIIKSKKEIIAIS